MIWALCVIFLGALWMWNRKKTSRARKMIAKFPGPKAFPIIGSIKTVVGTTVDLLKRETTTYNLYGKGGSPYRVLLGSRPIVVISHPKDFEILLSSQTQIDKGFAYRFFVPWLGIGLLTTTGSKWRCRRRILTPAFHYKILEDFLEIFKANVVVLVDKLRTQVNGPGFDVHKYISLYAFDNICETAMGVKINAQHDNDSEYLQAVRNLTTIYMQRSVGKPWLSIESLFNMSKLKSIQEKSLEVAHNTTNRVIKSRRAALEKERHQGSQNETDHGIGMKKRLAFLDILVEGALEGSGMTDEDIRAEVNTFMFGGHDTTSAAISFALWLLSWNQDIQDRVYRELLDVFPGPNDRVTVSGLQDLKYLERVIKETLRLYPSAPFFARIVNEDVTLSGGLVIPAGTNVRVAILPSHTNAAFWPEPLKFDPERFTPENILGRHPYAYIPFSAGPRNCIGQKYAMLQIKLTLSQILRAFKILPGSQKPDLQLAAEVSLVSANGIPVKLEERDLKIGN